jgi:Tfp pilus assembly protein PilW
MIGATIGSFVLVGVLSAFLMLGRSGTNIVAYTSMDTQTRHANILGELFERPASLRVH